MLLHLTLTNHLVAELIRARDRKFQNQSADRNVGLQGSDYFLVAQGTLTGLLYALFTKQIVTTGRLYSICVDV